MEWNEPPKGGGSHSFFHPLLFGRNIILEPFPFRSSSIPSDLLHKACAKCVEAVAELLDCLMEGLEGPK